MSSLFMVSLDPAQLNDFSALSVIEYSSDGIYRLLSLARKQHLPYPEIVSWSKLVYLNPKFPNAKFILDIGGVGKAIQDMLTAEGVKTIGIQLTGGDTETREGNTFHVSKSHVVGKLLQKWDESKVLILAKAPFLPVFSKELRAFRGSMSAQGRARFETEQDEHDDTVMSVAQAIWWCESRPKQPRLTYTDCCSLSDKLKHGGRLRPPGTSAPPSRFDSRPGTRGPPWSQRYF
jgi:hypothetical protein